MPDNADKALIFIFLSFSSPLWQVFLSFEKNEMLEEKKNRNRNEKEMMEKWDILSGEKQEPSFRIFIAQYFYLLATADELRKENIVGEVYFSTSGIIKNWFLQQLFMQDVPRAVRRTVLLLDGKSIIWENNKIISRVPESNSI